MVEIILTIIALAVFAAAMVVTLVAGRKFIVAQRFTHNSLVDLVFFFALYKVMAYYVAPVLFNILSNFRYVREDGVELISLVYLYGIEAVSWIAWLAGLIVVAVWFKRRGALKDHDLINENKDDLAKWSLVLLSLGFVYLRVTAIADTFYGSVYPWYLEVTKSLISYVGPPASVVLLVIGFKRWGLSFGILGLLTFVVGFATVSSRGALIYSIVFLVYLLNNFSASRKAKYLLASGILGLLVLYFSFGGVPTAEISIDDNYSFSIEAGVAADKKGSKTSLEEIEWRFGALSRMSTKFIDMYDRGDGAGINPIRNSFLGFLPRSVNPDKPHPSTVDGDDYYSQGMYLLYREVYGYNTYSMVEFSSGGHAYWEFGWFGVLVLSAISGIYIGLCLYYFQNLGLLSIPFVLATFKPWGYVDPKIWVSDIVMQGYQLILPLILIIVLYKIATFVRRFFVGML